MNTDSDTSVDSYLPDIPDDSDGDPDYGKDVSKDDSFKNTGDHSSSDSEASSFISDHDGPKKVKVKRNSSTPKSAVKTRRPHWSEAEKTALLRAALKHRVILRERGTKENAVRRREAMAEVLGTCLQVLTVLKKCNDTQVSILLSCRPLYCIAN